MMTSRPLKCPHCEHQFNVFAHSTRSEDWLRRKNEEYNTIITTFYICPNCKGNVSGQNAATKPPPTIHLNSQKGEYIKTLLLHATNDAQAIIDEINNAQPLQKTDTLITILSDIANSAFAKLTELQILLGTPQPGVEPQ